MKKLLIPIALLLCSIASFGQLQLGQPTSKVQMNGIWSLMKNSPYSATDSFLIYTKYQIDSLFGVIVGTPSFSFVNGGNGFSGYRSVLGNNNNIHLDIFTNGLRRVRINADGTVTLGDSAKAITVGAGGSNILGNTVLGFHTGDSLRGAAVSDTYIGSLAGQFDTTCIGCTFIGNSAGKNNRGNYNNFGGYNAGVVNTTGTQNAVWGPQAFTANTIGTGNTVLGYAAFGASTTANFGTALGAFSFTASNGGSNVGVGYGTGQVASTASADVVVGTFGMNHCLTCSQEVVIGHQARYTATAGDRNVAIGPFSLDSTNWYGNVALGYMSGRTWKGRGALIIADSIGRDLIFGDFLTGRVMINSNTRVPALLTNDNFQVNGTAYFSDTVKLPNIARKLLDTPNYKLVVKDASGNLFYTDWPTFGGSGIASLNGLTGSTQTFATGTSGTDFGINSTGTSHTFNIPDASNTARGLITTGTQNINGPKTFSNPIKVINMVQGASTDSVVVRASDGSFKVVSPNNPLNVNDVGAGRSMQYASGDSLHIRSILVNGKVPDTASDGTVLISTAPGFVQTADGTITNTSGNISILGTGRGSNTISANMLVAGSRIVYRGFGSISTAASAPTLNASYANSSSNASMSLSSLLSSSMSNVDMEWEGVATVRSTGSSGSVQINGWVSIAGTKVYTKGLVTLNTTISQTFDMFFNFGTASTSNTIVSNQNYISIVP